VRLGEEGRGDEGSGGTDNAAGIEDRKIGATRLDLAAMA